MTKFTTIAGAVLVSIFVVIYVAHGQDQSLEMPDSQSSIEWEYALYCIVESPGNIGTNYSFHSPDGIIRAVDSKEELYTALGGSEPGPKAHKLFNQIGASGWEHSFTQTSAPIRGMLQTDHWFKRPK
jgi:hypothetical protein